MKVSRPTVAKLMQEMGLKSNWKKKDKPTTTDSNHSLGIAANVLKRNFSPAKRGEVWGSDITYIPTLEGFLYLTVLDLYDRSSQHAATSFRNVLATPAVIQSMSRKGNCWDNAVAESFFKSLKTETIYGYKPLKKKKMETVLFEYIELWYNRKRRHSYIGNKTILELEQLDSTIFKHVA